MLFNYKGENQLKYNGKQIYAMYVGPAGYEQDEEVFKQLEKEGKLVQGELYRVECIEMGAYSTKIYLEGVDEPLNSVAFKFATFEKGKLQGHDIYKDPSINPYMDNHTM